jgi:hypothetical protein
VVTAAVRGLFPVDELGRKTHDEEALKVEDH